jgi:carboxypeptidase T
MQFASIRGTKAQLRSLRGTVRHLHDSSRRIGPRVFEIPAVLSDKEIGQITSKGLSLTLRGDLRGTLAKRLPGRKTAGAANAAELLASVANNDAYLPTSFVGTWTDGLGSLLPDYCSVVPLPYPTWEGRTVNAVRLRAGDDGPRPTVLFTSGMHAGEVGSADISVYFLNNLLNSYLTASPVVLGNYGLPKEHVQAILEHLEIVVVPCVNPDGRTYVETTQNWWRKNRNPNVGQGETGVDINRNFDFLWSSGIGSAIDPSDDEYRGPSALSEPESRNVQWLLDTTGAQVYIDIHGPSQTLVYTWGDAPDQSTDPSMNFQNPAWDGRRGGQYQEYIAPPDIELLRALGGNIGDAANSVRDGGYAVQQSFDELYPTTATSDDFAYSRHLVDTTKPVTYAYTFEYGGGDFIPEYDEMQALTAEVNAGMLALCDALLSNVG